jgi:competence protein ComFC
MFIKDFLFPKVCLSCGFLGSYICLKCQKKLEYVEYDSCIYCERRSFAGLTHPNCIRTNGVDGLIAIFYYNNILKKVIKNIKYRLVAEGLAELLSAIEPHSYNRAIFYKKNFSPLYLQPIPLHKNRLNRRGFNQSERIASFFGEMLSLPLIDVLVRTKNTESQARLRDRQNRFQNLRGAFEMNSKNYGDYKSYVNIMIVDDVVTSGSTVKEAAKILKKNNVEKVFVLALAKG